MTSPRRAAGVFRTPQSWETGKGVGSVGLRTSGMMPMEEEERSVNPVPQGVDEGSDPSEQSLQRALEKEVVTQLHEENMRLKQMLSRMQQSKGTGTTSTSEWSEVSGEKEETGRSFLPQTEEKKERIMFTPNGTRVPSQPPPVDRVGHVEMPELPPWPLDLWKDYEKEVGDRRRFKRLGGEPYRPSRELHDLPPEHLGRGMNSRQELREGRQVSGRGMNSRQEVCHQEMESFGGPQMDRERWLLRELAQLQQALDSEKRSKVRWRVDEDGHCRQVPLGRADNQGHQEQVPLGRADHPGHQEQAPLSRASHLGYQEGDRAKQWQQGEWGERGQEGVGSGGAGRHQDLPELLGSDRSPLVLGDWLEVIAPIMKDVSPQAHRWWPLVEAEARHYYETWRQSTPVERLYVKPRCKVVEEDPSLQRTEQRGISLLIKAVPESVKETIVSERMMTSTGIIFTLMKNFQPGGANERSMLLTTLTQPSWGTSVKEATATMRTWRRFHKRTTEIGAALPDATVLMKALEEPMQLVSKTDAQAIFRLSQARAMLEVDSKPTMVAVWNFSECLLAELESLMLVSGLEAGTKEPSVSSTPAVKMMQGSTSTTACKFWGSEGGCRLGKRCSFTHDWQALPNRASRCFVCSALTHRKQDCPARPAGDKAPTGGSGGQDAMGHGRGSKGTKGGKKGKGDTKGDKNGKGTGVSKEESLKEASVKALQGSSPSQETSMTSSAAAPSSAPSMAGSLASEKELIGEVTNLLKTLRVNDSANPQLSAVRLARILNQDKAVLIDGGATHCLRNPHSREEYLNHAEEVRVDLAAGSVRMRQDTGTGTLYSEDPNLQPIVPLADVIKVGVVVKWDSSGCEMRYRSGEKLPVFLQDGCPMLPMLRGMELLYEVEEFNRRKMKLRRAVTHPQPDRDREEEFMSRLARLFPEVPLRILERVPGKLNYDNDIMAINRRTRRQVERAETVILNLFSGPNTKIWTSHGQKGLLILNVEVLKGTDLLESNFYGYLEAQARFGRFSPIYAGPPCKTVSFCRFGHDQDGGPPPLRAREGALRFGLPWISPEQQEEADIDSTLWIKTLWLIHLARGSRSDFLFMVEQPRDPKEWREDDYALHGGHGYPSFLCWPETDRVMIAYSDVIEVRVDQGALGHKRKKPTTLVTNIHEVKLMYGLQDNSVQRPWPTSLQARMEESRSLAEWAPELKNLLLSVAIRVHRGQPPLRLRTTVPRMNALTAAERKDMEMWQNHQPGAPSNEA